MKPLIIRLLLKILNSHWLNSTPCKYGFIGNFDAFEREYLASEERQRPGITVGTVLAEAARFKACAINTHELTVLEADGTQHEATAMDLHELR